MPEGCGGAISFPLWQLLPPGLAEACAPRWRVHLRCSQWHVQLSRHRNGPRAFAPGGPIASATPPAREALYCGPLAAHWHVQLWWLCNGPRALDLVAPLPSPRPLQEQPAQLLYSPLTTVAHRRRHGSPAAALYGMCNCGTLWHGNCMRNECNTTHSDTNWPSQFFNRKQARDSCT